MKLTVEKFLKDGHLFQEGDVYLNLSNDEVVVGRDTHPRAANKSALGDNARFVVKARCLMLPKHFRLYQDVADGLIAVVDKQTGKYWWAANLDVEAYDIKSAVNCFDLGNGQDTDNLMQRNLVPITSFAQLGE